MSPPLLEVRDLLVRFGGVLALDRASFEADRGETVGLIGPNGAGKTTLINCLSGVVRPESGQALLAGTDLIGMRPHQVAGCGVARTFQNLGLVGDLDVESNLLLGRHHLSRGSALRSMLAPWSARRDDRQHLPDCRAVARRLGLSADLYKQVSSLPYGVRKRVELARALVADPVLLLADEPSAGLGLAEAREMLDVLGEWRGERGLAVVLVDHDMRVLMDAVDRLVVLDHGRVIAHGTPDDVRADPRVVAAYLGSVLP